MSIGFLLNFLNSVCDVLHYFSIFSRKAARSVSTFSVTPQSRMDNSTGNGNISHELLLNKKQILL